MHTLGKVFLWLNLLVFVPAAVLLSAKLINVRNYWMQQIAADETKIETNIASIDAKTKERDQLRSEMVRQRLAWDTMRPAPNSRADAQGIVTLGIGPDQGFANIAEGSPPPIVHIFVPADAEGQQSRYIGPFQVTQARASQTQLQPMFHVVGDPTTMWPPGTTWRVWEVIPSQAPSQVIALTSEILEKQEAVQSRQVTLAEQQRAVAEAQAHLDGRTKELLGDPDRPAIEGVPEVSEGLVATLQAAEAARNADLAELDRLRREIDQAYERLTALVTRNNQMTARPSGGPALSAAD